MDQIDIVPIMEEWLALLAILIVALNVWVRRHTSSLAPRERAGLDEAVKYDAQLW